MYIYMYIYLSIHLSIFLSTYLSIYLSIYVYIHKYICLRIVAHAAVEALEEGVDKVRHLAFRHRYLHRLREAQHACRESLFYRTSCINQMVSESQLPHIIVNLSLMENNELIFFVGELTF